MKKLLLMLGAVMAFSAAQAQYYLIPYNGSNPGGLNTDSEYPVGGGLAAGWTTLFTASAANIAAPAWSPVGTVPFAFSFNGAAVTDYKVSTSGILTFSTSVTAPPADGTNLALPDASIPDKSVMVWGLYPNVITSGGSSFPSRIITKTFGTAPNRQHWIQFNTFFPNTATTGFTFWSIVLEETTNKIYIVDQRSANGALSVTAGIQVNSTTAFQVAASPNVASQSTADPTPADNTYYAFTPGAQPSYDLSVTSLTNASYLVLANAPFLITGTIRNLGATPVTSFTLNYKINNGTTVSAPVTASIAPLATYSFTHPTSWTPAAAGNYTIEAWATDINVSNADMVTSNDSGSKQVSVLANVAPRTVLHEVFTSATCPPCKSGNANLHKITTANPGKSIDIKYQQNYPNAGNDPYQTAESISRHNWYGINSIPRMEVDGGWDGNANNYTASLLNNFQTKPALVNITVTQTVVGHTVTAQAVIDPIGNSIPSNNLVAHMVITEKRTVKNKRSNGETEFFDVMKKMMPNENGTAIAPLTGAPVTINQSYTFPSPVQLVGPKNLFPDSVENLNNLEVVVFLQDKVTKEVFQAAKSFNIKSGVTDNILAASLSVYPNPTDGIVNITFTPEKAENATLEIYNAVGARVWNMSVKASEINGKMIDADLSKQPNGFYFLNLKYGDQVLTKKIVLIK
ncbi:T9SS type A sorting domain-containing protein [Adhaeribacter sp. BT258]|uniref:T9SS type A sorting domain-containing protein n=1 Tax=Adhaeribacter terrigena TaxID=2793070 RepID=A0ABS1C4B9_9BACT|nr:T9SS type A sorting domain-containing protein [Adhaeribacter terrigena]MBK0404168.1 T9SS type A sorting domain-containing protein [Adhaeribacter terrigena]